MEQPSPVRPCPHCDIQIPLPPEAWQFLPPWQCSHCAGLFGVGESQLFQIPNDIKPLWPLFSWQEAKRFGFYAQKRFYVYAICYPSGLPFYVGKGQSARVCQHVEETWTLCRAQWTEKHNVIISLADRNESEWYHFLTLTSDQEEALSIEQYFIRKWGLRQRGGLLTNRVKPIKKNFQGGSLPIVPRVESVFVDRSPRVVHHPDLLIGKACGKQTQEKCKICNATCDVPIDLATKVVQCPYCAHLFKPMGKFEKTDVIEFGKWKSE